MSTFLVPSLVFSLVSAPVPLVLEPPPTPMESPTPEDEVRAKELFENGKELYLGGSYDAAIAAFKEAYSLSGDPVLLYNIYQAYDRANEYDAAIEYIEYYQAYAPASERSQLTEKIESLRRRKLKDDSETDAGGGSTGDGQPSDGGGSDSSSSSGVSSDDLKDGRVFTPLAIALTAVAVVGAGTGVGLGIASTRRGDDAETFCGGSPLVCSAQADGDLGASRNLAIGANVSFAVAGAAAIGAIVVIAINAKKRKSGASTSAKVQLQPSVSGLHMRF